MMHPFEVPSLPFPLAPAAIASSPIVIACATVFRRDAFVEFEDEEARRPLLTNVHPPGQILAELPAIRPVEEAGHPILPPGSCEKRLFAMIWFWY